MDENSMFQDGSVESEHALLDEGSCGISTEWGLRSRRFFSESGFEENIVDSGKEFVPDLEADSSDSNNDIFIFIIGIHATSRIKLCLDRFCFAFATEKGVWYASMKIYLTSAHPTLSKNVCIYCIVPSSLFTTKEI